MNEVPEDLMSDVAWSFSKVVSGGQDDFSKEVIKYNNKIENPIDEKQFTQSLPLNKIVIEYEYYIEEDSEWVETVEQFEISANNGQLSESEILYKIHAHTHSNLKGMDHCFFEGLEYTDEDHEDGIPIYEMILGS